ncbi:hypothetical protein ILUMI_20827 [Ignelater luminosus]|uniref:Uncharacterized protein n=1 Tax=Ignelater luminosus TaxID=2038154 RepID=A0A8K0G4H9_IGNLU|nr:hypothetical protein ILUMI_20827 [Ignelater luminosus]
MSDGRKVANRNPNQAEALGNAGLVELWKAFKQVLLEVTEEVCGKSRKGKGTKWWNDKVKREIKLKKGRFKEYLRDSEDEKTASYSRYEEHRRVTRDAVKRIQEQSTPGNVGHIPESFSELDTAIKKTKSGKAAGQDHKLPEMVMYLGPADKGIMLRICNLAHAQKKLQDNWKVFQPDKKEEVRKQRADPDYAVIITKTGRRQVGALSSAERGKTVTVEICFPAAGNYVLPILIFPEKRMKREFETGTTKEKLVLLLLAYHTTHTKRLALVDMALDNGRSSMPRVKRTKKVAPPPSSSNESDEPVKEDGMPVLPRLFKRMMN